MVKTIGIGLSLSSVDLLERLKNRNHVEQIYLSLKLFSILKNPPKSLAFEDLSRIIQNGWEKGNVLLFVGAIGAVNRLISPFLISKEEDPAVLVLDWKALNIVPILGGHLAGANHLAQQLAKDLEGKAIITNDSENHGKLSLDSFGKSWGWIRTGELNNWSCLMHKYSHGSKINFLQDSGSNLWKSSKSAEILINQEKKEIDEESIDIMITPRKSNKCCWHPLTIWIGIGCEKGTSFNLLIRAINESLERVNLAKESIAGFATINIKKNENCFLQLSEKLNLPIRFLNSTDLSRISVPNPSKIVESEVGSHSVSEASAIIAAGPNGELIQEKKIFHSNDNEKGAVTIAISESRKQFSPKTGELHLIGIGPGDISYMTADAKNALSRSVIWIGYSLYLDLVDSLRRNDQVRIDGKLTLEKERCLEALDHASQGMRVALISSGDVGIYGMASLALQVLLDKPEFARPKLFVHPGLSAMQLAAAKAGAPLGNDFCTISLSDRLTPWQDIQKRILGAAQGDFVIAFYNPKSEERNWQLEEAVNLLLKYRSKDTPVLLARQLGRFEESINTYELKDLPFNDVDMLTIVIVGNSKSKLRDGWLLTPRGYLD